MIPKGTQDRSLTRVQVWVRHVSSEYAMVGACQIYLFLREVVLGEGCRLRTRAVVRPSESLSR